MEKEQADGFRLVKTMMMSVVICTYNRSQSLARTLKSLGEISVPSNLQWEVIVVDNNSTDGTRAAIEDFAAESTMPVSYVFEKKQGLAYARNAGIEKANGDVIAFTDDDVLVAANWLKELARTFECYDAAGVGGKILPIWPERRPLWLTRDIEGNIALLDRGEAVARIVNTNHIFGANMAFPKAIFEKVGLFDPFYGRKGKKLYSHEEADLLRRVLESGGTVIYQPRAVVHHIIEPTRVKKAYFRKWQFDDGEFEAARLGEYYHRTMLGVPYYIAPEFGRTCVRLLKEAILVREASSFKSQLKICHLLGFMWGRVKYRLGWKLES